MTGACSTRNVGLVKSIGADAVIDCIRDDLTRGPQRSDVILDTIANHPLSHCRRALTPKGTLVPNTPGRWIGGYRRTTQALVMARFVRQRIRPFLAAVNHAARGCFPEYKRMDLVPSGLERAGLAAGQGPAPSRQTGARRHRRCSAHISGPAPRRCARPTRPPPGRSPGAGD